MAAPPTLPLTGADCFLRAFDAETRRVNGSSHLSQLVLRLGPGFDAARLEQLLPRVVAANPILRAPVGRPWGVGPPVYRLARAADQALPRVAVHHSALPRGAKVLPEDAAWPSRFYESLNERMDARRGELLRFDIVRYGDGDRGCDFAMTWVHLLMDGAGSERFVAYLDECARGEREPEDLPADEFAADAGLASAATLSERGQRARAWQEHMQGLAALPPRSLAGPQEREAQALRFRVHGFSGGETARVAERAKQMAGFLTPMLFYMAAAIRAHDAVFRARGARPPSYVVPLPVNARPKGSEEALFRTRVSMLWFQVAAARTDDLAALVEDLKLQRRDLIKAGAVENGIAAMDFARYAPKRLYSAMARRTFAGELCSFFFAWTGDFVPWLDSFMGAPILDGFHTPSVPASPGSAAILSVRAGRLNAVHVHQQGVLSEAELEVFGKQLRRDLLGADS